MMTMNNVEMAVVTMYKLTEFIEEIAKLVCEITDSCND